MEFEPGFHQVLVSLQHLAEKLGYGSIFACATVVGFVAYYGYKAWNRFSPSDATTLEAFCKDLLQIFDKLPAGASLGMNGSDPYEVQLANYVVNSAENVGYGKRLRKRLARSIRRVVLDSFGSSPTFDKKQIYYSTDASLPSDLRARLLRAMFRGHEKFNNVPNHNQFVLWAVNGRRFRQASDSQLVRATLSLLRDRIKVMAKTATDDYNAKLERAFLALDQRGDDRRPAASVQRTSSDRSVDRSGAGSCSPSNGRKELAHNEA